MTPPAAKNIATDINEFLSELNYNEVRELYELGKSDHVPRRRFEHEGWIIEVRPIPKRNEIRGKSGVLPIGMRSTGMHLIDDVTLIKNAIFKKAGKYGDLDLPYVIAVNVLGIIDDIDISEAFFGKDQIVLSQSAFGEIAHKYTFRLPDGAWIGPAGPWYTRVSAVLIVTKLSSYFDIPQAQLRLYHNPWAKRQYHSVLTSLSQSILKDNRIEQIEGETIGDIFNLPASWPEEST